ncbi:MAG: hypothetical protein Q9216_006946 [Gyalolechia sp. 2 TL-2023]
MGEAEKGRGGRGGGGLWLLPEEVVYLVERGSLDLRYRDPAGRGRRGRLEEVGRGDGGGGGGGEDVEDERGDGGADDEAEHKSEWDDVSVSLQACYAWFIGMDGLSLERYTVYAGLRRSGYIVLRAPGWYEDGEEEAKQGRGDVMTHPGQQRKKEEEQTFSIWQRIHNNFLKRGPRDPPPLGPLVGPGLYRSYSDIYRLLKLIPYHDPSQAATTSNTAPALSPSVRSPGSPVLRPHFHVYKPTPNFRKTAPGPPDFHLTVLSAREDDFPTLCQLDGLLHSVPYAPPPETETRSYQRVKHGYRNVVLAIVDQGIVSYMRVADAGFGLEKMYERGARRSGQGKRGGRGGGRGKGGAGRGRGR